jgi:hypothetical protein
MNTLKVETEMPTKWRQLASTRKSMSASCSGCSPSRSALARYFSLYTMAREKGASLLVASFICSVSSYDRMPAAMYTGSAVVNPALSTWAGPGRAGGRGQGQ